MTMAGFVTGASLGLRGAPSRSSICGRRPLSCAGVMMMADGEDGGDNGKKGGGMKNPFAALGDMKNMMGAVKKAQEFSGKAKEMQQELVDTEIEASAREGMVTVVMNGSQKPVSVQVSDEFMKLNTEEASKVLTECVVAAHKKSYDYAQDRMKNLAQTFGLPSPPPA